MYIFLAICDFGEMSQLNDSLAEDSFEPDLIKADLPSMSAALEPTKFNEPLQNSKPTDSLNNDDMSQTQLPLAMGEMPTGTTSRDNLDDSLCQEDDLGWEKGSDSTLKYLPEIISNSESPPQSNAEGQISPHTPISVNSIGTPSQSSPSMLDKTHQAPSLKTSSSPKKIPSFGKKKKSYNAPITKKGKKESLNSVIKKSPSKTNPVETGEENGTIKESITEKVNEQAKKPESSATNIVPEAKDVTAANKITPTFTKKPRKVLTTEEKEAKKLEQERKKLEREMKKKETEERKIVREKKKIEREQLKEQKRLEIERKITEKEQIKKEKELKKKEQKTSKETEKLKVKKKSSRKEDIAANENTSLNSDIKGDNLEELTSDGDESNKGMKDAENLCDDGDNKEVSNSKSSISDPEMNHGEGAISSTSKPSDKLCEIAVTSNTPPNQNEIKPKSVPERKKPVAKFRPPKQMGEDLKDPKPKQRKIDKKVSKIGETKKTKEVSGIPKIRKRKAAFREPDSDDEQQAKRSRPTNFSGPVWVQCENIGCQKWRKLKSCQDPSQVSEDWMCSMNDDSQHNSCSAPEEEYSDLEDSQEFIESIFIPGSIVWAKIDGYPW